MHGGTRENRGVLPAHPSSVPAARRLIRQWLAESGQDELSRDAELAVSELVTNALMHAGTPVEMSARLDLGFIRVEVADGSVHLPRTRDYLPTSGTGRGLKLLERTVDRWGAHRHGDGKVVWFELSAGVDIPSVRVVEPDDAPPPDAISVELLNLPLLLHAAWQHHAETLLRELLLVRLDSSDAEEALEAHAAACNALNLLVEQVPSPELAHDPDLVMAGAVGPLMTAERLVLEVPEDSVPHFDVLDDALTDAVALAEQGLLLTPPTQPEVRGMRRWLCAEVRRQAAGERPTRWTSVVEPLATAGAPLDWDASEVDGATTALVAADDTNRIVAVSDSALDLLGYGNRSELVGQRLVSLIPDRFHQAHLAGFTLHLTTGRSTLIGVPVTVPVLLRGGSEQLMQLTVTARHLPGGRRVFVAEMLRT